MGKNALPMHVNSLHQINDTSDTIMNMPALRTDDSNDAIDLTLKAIVTLLLSLQRTLAKFAPVISFIIEQLQLTNKRSLVYSSEFGYFHQSFKTYLRIDILLLAMCLYVFVLFFLVYNSNLFGMPYFQVHYQHSAFTRNRA